MKSEYTLRRTKIPLEDVKVSFRGKYTFTGFKAVKIAFMKGLDFGFYLA